MNHQTAFPLSFVEIASMPLPVSNCFGSNGYSAFNQAGICAGLTISTANIRQLRPLPMPSNAAL